MHPLPIPFTCKSPGQSFILSLKPADLMEFTASTAFVQLPNSCFALIHTTRSVTAWCIFFSLPAPNGEAGFVSEEVVEELIFFFPCQGCGLPVVVLWSERLLIGAWRPLFPPPLCLWNR